MTLAALAAIPEARTAIGPTPSCEVLRFGRATLRRYAGGRGRPLLIVHGLAGSPALTDLDAERSVARRLLAGGADVWLLDWGQPRRVDRFETLDDQIGGALWAAMDHVAGQAGAPAALLGVCEGGVMAACFAALWPERLSALILAVTPIDFHAPPMGTLARTIRAFTPDEIARVIDGLGRLPGLSMGAAFQALDPRATWAKYACNLPALSGDAEALAGFLRVERWIADRPDHPAAAAKQILIELYRENRLATGRLRLCGRRVDLRAITAPVLALTGARDHIVPPASAAAIAALVPQARVEVLSAGHVGVLIGRRGGPRAAALILETMGCAAPRG